MGNSRETGLKTSETGGAAPRQGLGRDAVIYGVGTSASQLLYVILLPVFTRLFSPAAFGTLDFLITLNGLLVTVATLGMNSVLFYFVNQFDSNEGRRSAAGTALILAVVCGLAVALLGVALTESLSLQLLGSREHTFALAMTFLWVPASLTTTLGLDLLRLQGRPVAFSAIATARALAATLLGIAAASIGGLGVSGLLGAYALTSIVAACIALWMARDTWSPVLSRPLVPRFLRFGLPLVPAGLALWVIGYADRYFLIQLLGAEAAGVYALAARGAAVVALVTVGFEAAWWPFAHSRARRPGHKAEYARIFAAVGIGLTALAALLSLFARDALLVIATPEYARSSELVGMLALGTAIYGLTPILAIGLQLARRTRDLAWITAVCAVLSASLNLILIPHLGIAGSAVASLVTSTAYAALVFVTVQRAYRVPYPVGRAALAIGATGLVMLAGVLVDSSAPAGGSTLVHWVAKGGLLVAAVMASVATLGPTLRRQRAT